MADDFSKKLEEFKSQQTHIEQQIQQSKQDSEMKIKNIMSEVLWRVKDTEELLKSRVSEVRVTALVNELKGQLNGLIEKDQQSIKSNLEEEIAKINSRIEKDKDCSIQTFTDIKTLVRGQDKKINELASRENIKALELADK